MQKPEPRIAAKSLLKQYCSGKIKGKQVVDCWPSYEHDPLLDEIINFFIEPDDPSLTHRDIAKIGGVALNENWSVDRLGVFIDNW